MKKELKSFSLIVKALVQLMFPYAEVVIHGLKSGKIAGIYNSFSKRKAGEYSLLDLKDTDWDSPENLPSFIKTGMDGRRIKSTTAVIKNKLGKAAGIFCINIDLYHFDQVTQ